MNYLLLLILSLCSLFSYAQRGSSKMKFDSIVYDFGKINEVDGAVSHKFSFVNSGDTPFIIESISVSCGCTKPIFSKKPTLPGESGEILITFNPAGRPGLFVNEIVIISNNREGRDVLVIKGDVNGKPRSIEEEYPFVIGSSGLRVDMLTKSIGYVEQGNVASTAISYVNVSSTPIAVEVKVYTENRGSSSSEEYNIEPKGRGDFTISCDLRSRAMFGVQTLFVEYYIDGVLQYPNSSITAIGTPSFRDTDSAGVPKAIFDSTFKSFGSVGIDDVLNHKFTIKNEGDGNLKIYSVQLANGVTCTLDSTTTIESGESAVFEIKLSVSEYNLGRVFANIYITLNDPLRPFREIRTVAYIE